MWNREILFGVELLGKEGNRCAVFQPLWGLVPFIFGFVILFFGGADCPLGLTLPMRVFGLPLNIPLILPVTTALIQAEGLAGFGDLGFSRKDFLFFMFFRPSTKMTLIILPFLIPHWETGLPLIHLH